MKHHIVVATKAGLDGWLRGTILSRGDFRVKETTDFEAAFQAISRGPCDLFVAEEWPGEPLLPYFLARVRASIQISGLKGIVIASSDASGPVLPPVVAALKPPVSPDDFNRTVAEALGLRSRDGRRHLLRMHLDASGEGAKSVGSVVSISLNAGGMLVESVKPLPVGKTYRWSFVGVGDLHGVTIPGTLIKEITDHHFASVHRYAVQFPEADSREFKALKSYIAENY